MKRERHTPDRKRRRFLRDTAMAGAGVAVAVTLPGLASRAESSQEQPSDEAQSQQGYRLTPHIAAYYKTMTS